MEVAKLFFQLGYVELEFFNGLIQSGFTLLHPTGDVLGQQVDLVGLYPRPVKFSHTVLLPVLKLATHVYVVHKILSTKQKIILFFT